MTTATPASELARAERDARAIHRAALAAVDAEPAVRAALAFASVPHGSRVFVIAIGKAAPAMARAAVASLAAQGIEPAGGLVVADVESPAPHPRVTSVVGDHPVPATRSAAAAEQLAQVVRQVAPRDVVWVMLSGGTTSLVGAPLSPLTVGELGALFRLLLGSGLEIATMNTIRKRVSRWGAGRLAVALEPAVVRALVVSDVPSDDLAAIGSGPLSPDPATATDVRNLLHANGLWDEVPASVRDLLQNPRAETPKRDSPSFRHVTARIVASNDTAVRAALDHAAALGYAAARATTVLEQEASAAGEALAAELVHAAATSPGARCLIRGGEPVVTLGDSPNAAGGRAQELALAAARGLFRHDGAAPRAMVVLAAGTDGRDGPTDAAGAIVSPDTWQAVRDAGRDPDRDLVAHDAYRALDVAGALLRTGPTGTNVMDLAILLVR